MKCNQCTVLRLLFIWIGLEKWIGLVFSLTLKLSFMDCNLFFKNKKKSMIKHR
eukprot:UN03336